MFKILLPLLLCALLYSAQAQQTVDLQIMLMIDDSGSIVANEYRLQVNGYISAFNNSEIINKLLYYQNGVAISVVFWSTVSISSLTPAVDVVIPWRIINDFTSIHQFISDFGTLALARLNPPPNPVRRFNGWTTISITLEGPVNNTRNPGVPFPGALNYFNSTNSGFISSRKVIDISSDGPNNILPDGSILDSDDAALLAPSNLLYVTNARDTAQSENIIINCLAVLSDSTTGLTIPLTDYYTDYLITNDPSKPGFAYSAADFVDFQNVIQDKLIREVSGDCFNVRQNATGGIFLSSSAADLPTFTIPNFSTFFQNRAPAWFDDTNTLGKWLTIQTNRADSICIDFDISSLTNNELTRVRYQCASPSAVTVTINGIQVGLCSGSATVPTDILTVNSGFSAGLNALCFNIPLLTSAQNGIWFEFESDVLRTFNCDSVGAWEYNSDCSECQCISGYFGQCCEMKIGNATTETCSYTPFDNLESKKNHTTRISTSTTGFSAGSLTINLVGGAVEQTPTQARRSLVSVGLNSLNFFLFGSPAIDEDPCSCFTKTSSVGGIVGVGSDICTDQWTLTSPWPTLRDDCCTLSLTDPMYYVYDCTIDVAHYDSPSFSGNWENLPATGRLSRSPLPLYIKFQRSLNLTSTIQVVADLNINAYISKQVYDPDVKQGFIVVDVVTGWPYGIALTSLTQSKPNNFNITYTFGPIQGDPLGRTCDSTPGSMCWQSLQVVATPQNTNPTTCDLDNVFTLNFLPSCRGGVVCPPLNDSQASTTVIASIHTENFCPEVYFNFPLNGTFTTYFGSFNNPTNIITVYTYPIDTSKVYKFCVKATVAVDYVSIGQGDPNEMIVLTFFKTLELFNPSNGFFATLYDNGVTCPGLASECASPSQIGLVIDTLATPNNYPNLAVNEAGACFYLTKGGSNPTPVGLLDSLSIDWHSVIEPVNIKVLATVGVKYDGETKRSVYGSGSGNNLDQTISFMSDLSLSTSKVDVPESKFSSASSPRTPLLLLLCVFVLAGAIFF